MKDLRFWFKYNSMDCLQTVGGVLVILFIVAVLVVGVIAVIDDIPVLEDSKVVDMTFTAAHTDIEVYTTSNSKGGITTHTRPVNYPNKWKIMVLGVRDNGEKRSEWWEIGEGMFTQIGIGDIVQRDPGWSII